jgi:hypothetical protein
MGSVLDWGQVECEIEKNILSETADNMVNLKIRINQYEKRNFVF